VGLARIEIAPVAGPVMATIEHQIAAENTKAFNAGSSPPVLRRYLGDSQTTTPSLARGWRDD